MTTFCGMPLTEVFFCEACCVIISVLLQIPTGAIADKWGRVRAVKIGCLLLVAELICFASATDRKLLWIGNILWSIGSSIISGAESALIYDSLRTDIKDEEALEARYKEIEGKSSAFYLVITALMSLLSGLLAGINMRLPVIIDIITMAGALISSYFFIETKLHCHNKKVGFCDHIIEGIKYVLKRNRLIWIISFTILIGVTSKLWFFTYNPYFEMVKLPVYYYGIVFFALNIVAGLSSYFANKIAKQISEKLSIIFSISAITVPMITMGIIISKWSVSLVLFQNLVRGYLGPVMNNMLNKQINSGNRATVLSVKSAIYQAVEVVCMFFFGFIIHSVSLGWAITSLGIVSTLFGIVLVFLYVKLFHCNDGP